jgi:hypothetical protein
MLINTIHSQFLLRCVFDGSISNPTIEPLNSVSQRKGEAEMSQIDELIDIRSKLSPDMAACSMLTSGDIDAIPIHLDSLSVGFDILPSNTHLKRNCVVLTFTFLTMLARNTLYV